MNDTHNAESVPPCPNCGGRMTEPVHMTICLVNAAREIERLRLDLLLAKGPSPAGFWSQQEWEEWSNELALLIPEDDVAVYANPEGAQESIIEDCFRAYVTERQTRVTPPAVGDES